MSNAKETLKQWCDNSKLSAATLSDDGSTLSLDGTNLSGKDTISLTIGDGKEVQYSLASIFLQILDPNQSLPKYRSACKKHQVTDPVKALDKPVVVSFFLESSSAADSAAAAPPPTDSEKKPTEAKAVAPAEKEAKEASDKDRKRSSSSSSRKDHHEKHRRDKKRSSSAHKEKHHDKSSKKRRSLVSNEQLFSNLSVVVDKRSGGGQAGGDEADKEATKEQVQQQDSNAEFEAIKKALSTEGFNVTPEMLEEHKEIAETLMAHEIPVGDSASVLRASSVGANLTRVLNLFMETVHPNKGGHKKGVPTPSPAKKSQRPYLLGKKPIILLPKGMTAPVTILNGYDFFANARFIPRDIMMRDKSLQANSKKTTFTHKMPGVGLVEYELLDNPRKLATREDWERVVGVIVLGHKWQFKDWPGKYSDPVQLFAKTFGFYIGMEGEKVSADLEGWACQRGNLHRDKRGLDSVTFASFWNSLDQWVRIHRPELLPVPE